METEDVKITAKNASVIRILNVPKDQIKYAENFEHARTNSLLDRKIPLSSQIRKWDEKRKISVFASEISD